MADRIFLYQDTPKSVAVSTVLATGTLALLTQAVVTISARTHGFILVNGPP